MNSACRHILWLSFESTSHKYKMRFSIWGNLFNDYEKKNFTITPKVGNSQGVVALSCSSGVLRVLPESPDCGHSNLTNGLKLLQHLEKKEGRKAKADWHHSLISWPGGRGKGGNRMPRVKDWQKPGQANKSEIATFFLNFPTFLQLLGLCLGIPPRKGLSFVENGTLCNWKKRKKSQQISTKVGAKWVCPTLILICSWFLGLNAGEQVAEKKVSPTLYPIIQRLVRNECLQL